jgi:hypothetical protein
MYEPEAYIAVAVVPFVAIVVPEKGRKGRDMVDDR